MSAQQQQQQQQQAAAAAAAGDSRVGSGVLSLDGPGCRSLSPGVRLAAGDCLAESITLRGVCHMVTWWSLLIMLVADEIGVLHFWYIPGPWG